VDVQENIEQGRLKFYMNQLERVGASGSYINRREVTKRFRVPPGAYITIPSTYDCDKPGKFLLRMYTEKEADQA
jgi:calpain-2